MAGADRTVEIWQGGSPVSAGNPLETAGGGGGGASTIADGADVNAGATTDAAETSDSDGTLSGKLRGLVKWAFERMPASLGQKTMAASLPVVVASDQSKLTVEQQTYTAPASGELAGSATAVQMPNVACKLACFKAADDNAGYVYIGFTSGVTVANGATDTTTGYQLTAGESTPWLPIDNLNRCWRICDNAGDDLTYMVMV